MVTSILLGCLLILITSIVHGITTVIAFKIMKETYHPKNKYQNLVNLIWIDSIVLLMILVSLIESLIWAAGYISIGVFTDLEDALYFSIVTFTTLGYGDIVLGENWRLLASLQAANGIIMFGWSTAIVITSIQKIFTFNKKPYG